MDGGAHKAALATNERSDLSVAGLGLIEAGKVSLPAGLTALISANGVANIILDSGSQE